MEKLLALWGWLKGKKTYAIVIISIAYAILGAILGHISWQEASDMILVAAGFGTVRHSISPQ